MNKIAPYLKAITGAIVAGLTALGAALSDNEVTAGEWVTVAIAFFAGLGLVWAIPNKDPEGKRQDESVQPPNLY